MALLTSISFLNHFNRISMPVAGNRIMDEYQIPETEMGWVYSALLISYTLCMTPGGWFSDRWGARAALVTMGFGSAAFCALTGLAGRWAVGAFSVGLLVPSLLVVRGVMGAFMAPIYPAAGRIVSHWIAFGRRALANAIVTCAAPLGVACAYPVFARLSDWFGWEAAFVITGLCTAALASIWTWYGKDDPREHPSANEAERRLIQGDRCTRPSAGPTADAGKPPAPQGPADASSTAWGASPRDENAWRAPVESSASFVVRNRSLWLLTASYAAVGYVEYLLFYWSEYYFKRVLQFGEQESRLAAMIPPLAMAVGMPLGGWLSDRLMEVVGYRRGRAAVALAGMTAAAALLFAGTLTSAPVSIVACLALALGAIGICEGPAWATAIDLGGARGGTSAAIANTGGNAGGFMAPVVTPWVGTQLTPWLGPQLGWAWGLRLGSIICLLGACLWLWIDAAERAAPSRDTSPS